MYEQFLINLLAPLGVYDLSAGSISEAELYALGRGLDAAAERIDYAEREGLTATALDEGLRRREALFARRPAASGPEERRAAIAALLQIAGDSLTPEAIGRTIRGCGIRAKAVETGDGNLQIIFPDTPGIPAEFEQIQKIILDIIPCHLGVGFFFRFLTWALCERAGYTWASVEAAGHTWESFPLALPPDA